MRPCRKRNPVPNNNRGQYQRDTAPSRLDYLRPGPIHLADASALEAQRHCLDRKKEADFICLYYDA